MEYTRGSYQQNGTTEGERLFETGRLLEERR